MQDRPVSPRETPEVIWQEILARVGYGTQREQLENIPGDVQRTAEYIRALLARTWLFCAQDCRILSHFRCVTSTLKEITSGFLGLSRTYDY
jgi:hypothetical protein